MAQSVNAQSILERDYCVELDESLIEEILRRSQAVVCPPTSAELVGQPQSCVLPSPRAAAAQFLPAPAPLFAAEKEGEANEIENQLQSHKQQIWTLTEPHPN